MLFTFKNNHYIFYEGNYQAKPSKVIGKFTTLDHFLVKTHFHSPPNFEGSELIYYT